jgi:hypothetical protein
MFLRFCGPRSLTLKIESLLDLTIGVFGKTDRARPGNAFKARGDVDAIAHQIAVALLDHVANMDADPKLDALLGRQARVALDHAGLHFNSAADRVYDAAKLNDRAVASALDDVAVMHRDGRVDQIAAERPKPRQNAVLVDAGQPAIANDICNQDRREFSTLAHWRPSG